MPIQQHRRSVERAESRKAVHAIIDGDGLRRPWHGIKRGFRTLVWTVGIGLVSASCNSGSVNNGYLYVGTTEASFIQWTKNGNVATGTLDGVALSSNGQNVHVHHWDVSTAFNGTQLVMKITGSTQTTTVNGKFVGSDLYLFIPQSNGSLTPVTFKPSNTVTYNSFVSKFQTKASAAQQQAAAQQAAAQQAQAQQQAAAQQAQATQQAQDAVNADVQQVGSDMQSLKSDEAPLQQGVNAIPADLMKESNDLATAVADEQTAAALASQHPNGDSGSVCSDADTVVSDADSVNSDSDTVNSDVDTVNSDILPLQQGLSTLKADVATYQTDQSKVPSFVATGTPSSSTISQAIAEAQGVMNTAVVTTNQYIDKANSMNTSAYNVANTAEAINVGGQTCGSPASSPTPIPHITANSN